MYGLYNLKEIYLQYNLVFLIHNFVQSSIRHYRILSDGTLTLKQLIGQLIAADPLITSLDP